MTLAGFTEFIDLDIIDEDQTILIKGGDDDADDYFATFAFCPPDFEEEDDD